jgi:hypothetical protein
MMKNKVVRPAIATWYQLVRYKVSIGPVPVVAFTDKTVTVLGENFRGPREERNNIHSEYYDYYPTWEEAHQALSERWQQKEKSAESTLADAKHKVSEIARMTNPGLSE